MTCEKQPIGEGLMRCRRCRMDWFERTDPPPQCVNRDVQESALAVVQVPDFGLVNVRD